MATASTSRKRVVIALVELRVSRVEVRYSETPVRSMKLLKLVVTLEAPRSKRSRAACGLEGMVMWSAAFLTARGVRAFEMTLFAVSCAVSSAAPTLVWRRLGRFKTAPSLSDGPPATAVDSFASRLTGELARAVL